MPPLFGTFQVRVDPWEVEYGSETPLEPLDDTPDEDVVLDVEVPPDQWSPLNPGPVRAPERVYFVDGVRRLETRLVVNRSGKVLHGGFGSFAVGCVEPGRSLLEEYALTTVPDGQLLLPLLSTPHKSNNAGVLAAGGSDYDQPAVAVALES
jgi:hypothetical protein